MIPGSNHVRHTLQHRTPAPVAQVSNAGGGRAGDIGINEIRYSLAEHSVTLSGVSATMVRVNDDLFGTQYWVSKATFEASWRDFNNMAVIFR